MQMSAVGGIRNQIITELKALAPILSSAEDLHRTKLEKVEREIKRDVNLQRPIGKIATKISVNSGKLPEKYAPYIVRLTFEIGRLSSPIYLEMIKNFQNKYPSSVLPEALNLQFVARSKERVEKLALIVADNCLAHNRRVEKLSKRLQQLDGERGHELHQMPTDCKVCKIFRDTQAKLDSHVRDGKRAEVTGRNLWIETSELRAREKSAIETLACWALGAIGGAVAGLAVNAVGNSAVTVESMQAGAQAGPGILIMAKGVVTGDPQIVNLVADSRFRFRTLGARVTYAFQPDSSGLIGYYVWNNLSSHPSHTVGLIQIRLNEEETITLTFNAKAFFPVEPMAYWQLCQKLWQQVTQESNKLHPRECLDILQQLENGPLVPANNYPPVRGVVDERLAFCTDRLKRYCEALISATKEEPQEKKIERRPDYSLQSFCPTEYA